MLFLYLVSKWAITLASIGILLLFFFKSISIIFPLAVVYREEKSFILPFRSSNRSSKFVHSLQAVEYLERNKHVHRSARQPINDSDIPVRGRTTVTAAAAATVQSDVLLSTNKLTAFCSFASKLERQTVVQVIGPR